MPTVTDTARDQVLPAVRSGLTTARNKGGELLTSDAAHEARRRGVAIVKAARGEPIVTSPGRRWTFGLGMLALGTALGAGALWVARRLTGVTPYDAERTTFHDATTPASNMTMTSGTTANDNIDLRAGAPTGP